MPKEKRPVYNGYTEEYLTGQQLKRKFQNTFYTGGRHHSVVFGIPIPVLFDLTGIEEDKTYRVFFNDWFCAVLNEKTDAKIKFFGYAGPDDFKECHHSEILNTSICPKCGAQLEMKLGRYGEFVGCKVYPNCKFTTGLQIIGNTRDPIMDSILQKKKTNETHEDDNN